MKFHTDVTPPLICRLINFFFSTKVCEYYLLKYEKASNQTGFKQCFASVGKACLNHTKKGRHPKWKKLGTQGRCFIQGVLWYYLWSSCLLRSSCGSILEWSLLGIWSLLRDTMWLGRWIPFLALCQARYLHHSASNTVSHILQRMQCRISWKWALENTEHGRRCTGTVTCPNLQWYVFAEGISKGKQHQQHLYNSVHCSSVSQLSIANVNTVCSQNKPVLLSTCKRPEKYCSSGWPFSTTWTRGCHASRMFLAPVHSIECCYNSCWWP